MIQKVTFSHNFNGKNLAVFSIKQFRTWMDRLPGAKPGHIESVTQDR